MSILIKNIILGGRKRDIFVKGNKIEKIASGIDKKAEEKFDGKGEKAVLPGLINCHCHSAMTLFRGYADDISLKEWLEKKIWPLESKLKADDIYWGTKLASLEMLKTGTTFFNDMYWYPEAQIEAVKEMGIRAKIGLTMFDFLPAGSKENIEKLYEKLKDEIPETVELAISPHSIYTVSRKNLIWAKNFSQKNKLLLHIHLSETEKEVRDCLKKRKMRPVEYLDKIGFLGRNTVLAHSIYLSDKEIRILEKRKCSVIYNPCSNMKLASGIFPYQEFKKAGVNICLGTDGPASNNSLDMFEEMKFASLLQKINKKKATAAPAPEIFKAATKNGAKAMNLNSGEIKEGKLADLILVDLNQISLKPGHDLISGLVYSASGNCVSDTVCNGIVLMRSGRVEGEEKILKETEKRAKKLISIKN